MWTVPTILQPISFKSDRPLESRHADQDRSRPDEPRARRPGWQRRPDRRTGQASRRPPARRCWSHRNWPCAAIRRKTWPCARISTMRMRACCKLWRLHCARVDVVVGHPLGEGGQRYNAASVLAQGQVGSTYRKQKLPNYSVFDEVRTFETAMRPACSNARACASASTSAPISGSRPGQPGPGCRRASPAGAQCLAVPHGKDRRTPSGGARPDPGMRPACDLRQHGGRPGRTGVRWRFPSRSMPAASSSPSCPPSTRGCITWS